MEGTAVKRAFLLAVALGWSATAQAAVRTETFEYHDGETALDAQGRRADAAIAQLREGLAAYKLEVAKNYASMTYLKDVERRLTAHLLRI